VLIRARKELGGRSRPALFCGRRLEILLNLILIFLLLPHLHRFLFSLLGKRGKTYPKEARQNLLVV
jgi:hypothetical protein